MSESTDTYIAVKPTCGHMVACIVDIPDHARDTAKEVAAWIKDGLRIERVVSADIRAGKAEFCRCDRKAEKEQLKLF